MILLEIFHSVTPSTRLPSGKVGMFTPLEGGFGHERYGDFANRIGNEIMINAKDLV